MTCGYGTRTRSRECEGDVGVEVCNRIYDAIDIESGHCKDVDCSKII